MKETEATILKILRNNRGNILDDEQAITVLKQSNTLSEEIKKRQKEEKITEASLNEARLSYHPIANHSAMLFFLVSKLSLVDVMYSYSLTWFIQLF